MTTSSGRQLRGGRDPHAEAEREAKKRAEQEWEALLAAASDANEDDLLGMGHMSVFHFARAVKSRNLIWPDGRRVTGEDAALYIEETHARATPTRDLRTEDAWEELGLETDSGDVRAEFVAAWDSVRVPAGSTLWETAQRKAREHPCTPNDHAKNPKYVLFISLAAHLQLTLPPGEAIALPVGKVAKFLGVSEKMVSIYRGWATQGLLTEVAPYSREKKRATRFRFALDQFPGLR